MECHGGLGRMGGKNNMVAWLKPGGHIEFVLEYA